MSELIQRFFVYGCLGMLVEVFFTGVGSLLRRNWRATSQTYLWMLPIYGGGGLILEGLRLWLAWPPIAMAFVYVVAIYVLEFTSGWALKRLIGRCPWDYGASRFSIMGLVRLDYAPFWLGLALVFHPVSLGLHKAIAVLPPLAVLTAGP